MHTERGVTCYQCGGSAVLPDDLTTPTFACRWCHQTLETGRYAGSMAVSADALAGYLSAGMARAAKGEALDVRAHIDNAPKFEHGSAGSRELPCRVCQAPLAVPLDVTVPRVTCAGCHQTQAISDYISDQERFEIDQARQVAGNEALRRLETEGAPCARCGGRTPVSDRGIVQLPCAHCGAMILLKDVVDPSAVARQRLARQVLDEVASMREEHERTKRERDNVILVFFFVGLVAVAILGALLKR
ncbi:MAG: hypothetical protein U0325_22935 [Polyangiales bacterium]